MNGITRTIKKMLLVIIFFQPVLPLTAQEKPNIIFVLEDDVGYGDIGRLGSPVIQTPGLDRLYDNSVHLTNYHTAPTCSPTRAGIMTGQHYDKVGVWHTIIGRSILRQNITTLPEILKDNGYFTGIFGKWHLGDNYPFRPGDRGFEYTLVHRGGGVGQTPDFWGNKYFDDTYWRNGKPEKFNGYCTDIWFREAMKFMEKSVQRSQPFFCYLSLNAAHAPNLAPQKLVEKYQNIPGTINPGYNAQVENIDENMGKLMDWMDSMKITDNTILIFCSDNGTSRGAGVVVDKDGFVVRGFNAGMRGVKGTAYEGGHREPFFIRYPDGNLLPGRDVDQLSSCLDVLPTLLSLCGIKKFPPELDGEDLVPYLKGAPADKGKIYIADSQRDRFLTKWKEYSVMQSGWRYVNGELFDLDTDPEQRTDVSDRFPRKVAELKQAYEEWWDTVIRENEKFPFVRIPVLKNGTTEINCMDIFPASDKELYPAWNQEMVKRELNVTEGDWKLTVDKSGWYEVTIRQFPIEAGDDSLPVFSGEGEAFVKLNGKVAGITKGLKVKKVSFKIKLQKGPLDFSAGFADKDGKKIAAQYVYFKKL